MSEYEPQPKEQWQLHWESDIDGEYVLFRKNGYDYRMTADDVGVFTFSYQPEADHIYYCNTDGDQVIEDYTFRAEVDEKLGEGVFDFICREFSRHGFAWELAEHPTEIDILEYHRKFGLIPKIIDPFEQQAAKECKNLDKEWAYYSDEPGWS
jgi:hypothetical protein